MNHFYCHGTFGPAKDESPKLMIADSIRLNVYCFPLFSDRGVQNIYIAPRVVFFVAESDLLVTVSLYSSRTISIWITICSTVIITVILWSVSQFLLYLLISLIHSTFILLPTLPFPLLLSQLFPSWSLFPYNNRWEQDHQGKKSYLLCVQCGL